MTAFFAWLFLPLALAAAPPPEAGRLGLVASDHALASRAGAEVLEAGGNAVDAAVAAALAAGVVQPAGSGLGGGGFAVLVLPDGTREVLDFREVAPAAADRDLFSRAAEQGRPDASQTGGLAVAVPAEALGLAELHRRHGRLSLARVTAPALRLAARGFRIEAHLARALGQLKAKAAPLSQALFGQPPPQRGEWVRRRRLAGSLRAFSASKGQAFRSGWVARDLVQTVVADGGVLTAQDLLDYQVRDRPPLVGAYRGWTVTTMPPPSSGGAVLLQVLGVLEAYDLAALGWGSAPLLHLQAEAMQHAYADRAHFMGDPDRVAVPLDRLLAPGRIEAVRQAIDPQRTFPPEHYGLPVDPGQDAGTQHISALDRQGMAVALTTTVNTSFGAELVAPKSGIVLNDQMDDFVARPGQPNAFGLIGSEANAVAPGARPLSSMSPTVLEHPDGRRIVIGASGGPQIISATLQVLIAMIDFGMDPAEAVAAPRAHHQWQPPLLILDKGVAPEVQRALEALGHRVEVRPHFSAVQVATSEAQGPILGASDPRKGGQPSGAW